MIQVWYSNRLAHLVDGLVEAVGVERRRLHQSAFDRSAVVVPNWQMETYLKYEVARRTGIAARLEYQSLVDLFGAMLPDDGAYRVIDERQVQCLIIEALADDAHLAGDAILADDAMAPVRAYLSAAGDDADARQMRRVQLSRQLAGVFIDYDFNRPQMVDAWLESTRFTEPPWQGIERWQRALWLHLFGAGGRLDALADAQGVRYLRLTQLFRRVPDEALELPNIAHLFGVGRLGRAYERLLGELAERTQVYVWALNPCREFWEDVVTDIDEEAQLLTNKAVDGGQLTLVADGGQPDGGQPDDELAGAELADAELADDGQPVVVDESFWEPQRFPLPLRLWGRVGRDKVRMLNRLGNHDARALFDEPAAAQPTVLRQLQRDVLCLQPEGDQPVDGLDDDSVTVLACPNIQREVEILANEIWSLMRGERDHLGDRPLQLNEICVVVNRQQRVEYQTRIESVFRDVYNIPFHVVDLEAGADSRLLDGLDLLLDLPFGDFRRSDLLSLLTHPNVIAAADDVDADRWLRWCDELSIVHGADHADHADTYITHDLYNWDQGLKRLVLGGFMTGAQSGDERIFEHNSFEYLPYDAASAHPESAAQLVATARALIKDARRFRRERMPLAQWTALVGDCIDAYFAATEERQEFELMRCRQMLAELADADLGGAPVSYRVARELIGETFDGVDRHRGQYLADGVVVSSMMPDRPRPFRAILVAGMGEAYFPSSEGNEPLDLRQAKWQEGDANGRDRDKYAFLQTLLAAKDRFYASYVARDSRTGEPIEPSSVVRDLMHLVDSQRIDSQRIDQNHAGSESASESAATRVIEHPLRRFDPAYFDAAPGPTNADLGTNYHPEARREAAAWVLRDSLQQHCRDQHVAFPKLDVLADSLAEPARQVVGEVLGSHELLGAGARPTPPAADDTVQEVSISLSQLRRFLESPLQASARWNLGLRDDTADDVLDVDDERFDAPYVGSLLLCRDVFLATLCDRPADEGADDAAFFASAYDRRAHYLELRGDLPTGPFFDGQRQHHLALLETWRQNLGHLGVATDQPLEVKRFGRARRRAAVDEILASMTFEVDIDPRGGAALAAEQGEPASTRRVRVELYGDTEALGADHRSAATMLSRSRVKDKDVLAGFLTHVALAAGGKSADDQPFEAVVVPAKSLARARKMSKYRRPLAPICQADARAYLKELVADFVSGVHPYLMPVEAVFDYVDAENETPFGEIVDQKLTTRWSSCSSEYGPVRQPDQFGPPADPDALIARRFGPLFGAVGADGSDEGGLNEDGGE